MAKDKYIFIVQLDDGELVAERRENIEEAISDAENLGEDIEFTTIARLKEPEFGLPIDFNSRFIEFFKPEEADEILIHKATTAIVKLLMRP